VEGTIVAGVMGEESCYERSLVECHDVAISASLACEN
jgi:hypothetical protein